MQLTYRGIQYNVAPASTRTTDSGITATYRGLSYSVPQSSAVATLPKKALKYRGIVIGTPEVNYQPVSRSAMA